MEGEITISKETINLAYAVHEAGFVHLQHELGAEHLEFLREWSGLEHNAEVCDRSLQVSEYERKDAPSALLQSLAIVLHLLPSEEWPEEANAYADQCPLALEALRVIGTRVKLKTTSDVPVDRQEAPM